MESKLWNTNDFSQMQIQSTNQNGHSRDTFTTVNTTNNNNNNNNNNDQAHDLPLGEFTDDEEFEFNKEPPPLQQRLVKRYIYEHVVHHEELSLEEPDPNEIMLLKQIESRQQLSVTSGLYGILNTYLQRLDQVKYPWVKWIRSFLGSFDVLVAERGYAEEGIAGAIVAASDDTFLRDFLDVEHYRTDMDKFENVSAEPAPCMLLPNYQWDLIQESRRAFEKRIKKGHESM
jgi:hypothetical protein